MKKQQHHQIAKRSRSPAGPRRLRNSDAHKRIAAPKAFCVLQERLRPRPKSGKVCRFKPRPGEVYERAERSEGNDTIPIAICALNCSRQNGSNSLESLADRLLLKFESLNLLEMYNEH